MDNGETSQGFKQGREDLICVIGSFLLLLYLDHIKGSRVGVRGPLGDCLRSWW